MLGLRPRTSCREHFPKLGFLTIPSLYFLSLVMFVKKHPEFFSTNHEYYSDDMTIVARGRDKLSIPVHGSAYYERGPHYICIKVFNLIPHHLKAIGNMNEFKREISKLLLQKCLYSFNFEAEIR